MMGHALRRRAEEVGTEIEDPEAISAVLLAGLSYLPVMQVLLGRTPGDIDSDRFREAWLRLSRAVFTHGVPRLDRCRQLRGLIVAAQCHGFAQRPMRPLVVARGIDGV